MGDFTEILHHLAGWLQGASGFVVDAVTADELGMESFGELAVTGMAGKVKSKYRCVRGWVGGWARAAMPLFLSATTQG